MRAPAAAAAALALLLATGCGQPATDVAPAKTPSGVPTRPPAAAGPVPVLEVIDGDTVLVERAGAAVTVRLIGIDAPETVHPDLPVQCYGPQAAAYVDQLLGGRAVQLEHDPTAGRTDRYGRELAYLWLPDGQLANLLILAGGYAREAGYGDPYRYAAAFRAAQRDARDDRRGLWGAADCQ